MIYYFSGTGNSLFVAQQLAEQTATEIAAIAEISKGKPMPPVDDVTGIVYPVFAWAPPHMVLDFVARYLKPTGYLYAVCTCGEEAGRPMKRLEKVLGRKLDSAFSITMPNNYIIGFDVDARQVVEQKLAAAEEKIAAIAQVVNSRKSGVYDVCEGPLAGVKSSLVPPFFNTFALSAKPFWVENSCNGCKRCETVCPTRNIHVENKPSWGNECTYCLACLHHCPVQAIQRGRGTKQKGRYVNPHCRVAYDFGSPYLAGKVDSSREG